MYKFIARIAIGAGLLIPGVVYSADFTEADELFKKRGESTTISKQARQKYRSILSSGNLNNSEKIYAATQISRLLSYEGSILDKTTEPEKSQRKNIYGKCWREAVELMAPSKVGGPTPNYYYFKASCMALYGEVSGTLENLQNVGRLRKAISEGKQYDTTYEGGGILRVEAGVISNPKAKPIPGLYKPEAAASLIDQAIESPAYPGSSNAGSDYCENYKRKVMILQELGKNQEAKAEGIEARDYFELLKAEEILPEGIEEETKICIDYLNMLISKS